MSLLTSAYLIKREGQPTTKNKNIQLWDVPSMLEIGQLPDRVYCHKAMVGPLTKAFQNIVDRGLVDQIKTWDGCFNIRQKRGASSWSLHSWAVAIDINAAWNGFGAKPTMTKALVKCFTDAGFDWGGLWTKPDGMHFQLTQETYDKEMGF